LVHPVNELFIVIECRFQHSQLFCRRR